MFTTGIYINEKDLDPKTPTNKTAPKKPDPPASSAPTKTKETMTTPPISNDTKDNKDNKVTTTTDGDKVTSATAINKAPGVNHYISMPIPKPDPIPNPPTSDSVDAGLGPRPEPVARPPSTSLPFKLLWAMMVAPSNPSV